MLTTVSIAVLISALCLYKYRAGLRKVNGIPGIRSLFSPLSPLGATLPCTSWNPGHEWPWHWRKTAYFNHTYDVISTVPIVVGSPSIYTNSFEVAKQLLYTKSASLEKPREMTSALQWGDNVTSVNGDIWRLHRRIVAPSFNQKMYDDVWRAVRETYAALVTSDAWDGKDIVDVPKANIMLLDFTITIICSCGFGIDVGKPGAVQDSSRHAFRNALRTVSETYIHHLLLPAWAYNLPIESIRKVKGAWSAVEAYIMATLRRRKEEDPGAMTLDEQDLSGDILNRLVMAWASADKYVLSEQEVLSNMFALVFAGHETTASGITATLAYLSLNPDIQQTVFTEISQTTSELGLSQYVDPSKLAYTFFCFLEALRLVPSPMMVPRRATEDLVLHVVRPEPGTVFVSKGTLIIIDLIGLSRNPHVFEDPDTFRPERWAGVPEQDIALFGLGHRACIGRKFAQTEVLSFLASLLLDWKVEPLLGPGETRGQYTERVMKQASLAGTAFSLKEVPLRFVRRSR
ncbi:cytochrome P450 [Stereum hirsutum FP-91666 SS1]|uniref:cytochrome P450 n=1 Tax=Stereum hirsutum (strain FP-91666) TaxID=721885 RepID=UPI0004449AA5|nr:cytochrome P450 [Stereum hirsutum FP-91666 SS1]EIM82573.1 cytochrome P450 [Stereum hirsutum FP-91666 SS1]